MKPRKSKLSVGSDLLQNIFENGRTPLSIQFLRWKLWKKWPDFAGPTIAAVSEPVGYFKGSLYVWVKSSTWMQQLVFMREPLKDSINEKLGFAYVKEIKLTLDRRQVPVDAQEVSALQDSVQSLMKDFD